MIPKNMRKNQSAENKKRIIAAIVGAVSVIICVAIIIFVTSSSDGAGSSDDIESTEQSCMQEDMSYSASLEEETGQSIKDEKEYYVNFVDLAVLHNGSGVFDIHIRFPNGEDYVVVARKEINDVTDDGFYIMLDDRENHMLSSAKTDYDVYIGTQLYLSRYEKGMSETVEPDYPWNQYVLSAHGLNEMQAEEVYARRVQLEENLAAFMNQTLSK